MIKKIVFLTFHNWETKRQGGFHKFAEAACERGYETIFFSFARPFYIYFKNEERLNKKVLIELSKGKKYKVGSNEILNITFPTLALPGLLKQFVPKSIDIWLQKKSFKSFKRFAYKYFSNTNYFVFESNESILLFDIIKKLFPKSKIIYRPSDPLLANPKHTISNYEKIILKSADWAFLVNQEGEEIYKKQMLEFKYQKNYSILSNGISIAEYQKKYPVPDALKIGNTALYVGALIPEWELILEASLNFPNINFVIICPNKPNNYYFKRMIERRNINYISGISPSEVPSYVKNASVIIIPYPQEIYKTKPWGITAKYYQAMAANKPIIAFHDTPALAAYGIHCTYDYDSFLEKLRCMNFSKPAEYEFDFKAKDWNTITDSFFKKIESL